MTSVIKFGTDGWRAVIAEDYTFDNVRLCAQGVAQYLLDTGQAERGMVVGYDYRFASEHFAAAAAEVLAGNGIKALLCQAATPTPVISYAILAHKTAGAINITASHNPPWDNGFKVRSEYAGAASPETLHEIESRIERSEGIKRLRVEEATEQGLIEVIDAAPPYLTHLRDLIDVEPIKQAGLHIATDAMWGVGAGWFEGILAGGETRVTSIRGERNPIFPRMARPEPIPPNVDELLETVRATGADIGLATDGDADRLGVADEHGNFVDQLQVYGLLAYYLLEVRGWRGPIVKTLSTTSMLDKLGKIYDVPVYETGVGFKYIAPKMVEVDAMIGGEESGGFAFRGHMPERDGILAGLFILDLIVKEGKSPSELIEHLYSLVGEHHYGRIDPRFPQEQRATIMQRLRDARPTDILGVAVTDIQTFDGFKYLLADGSWLLIRFSGTEPIMRIYTETTSRDRIQPILEEGVKLAGLQMGESKR